MKYFFLSNSWTTGRVWEFGGLWDARAQRRQPHLQKLAICIQEDNETLNLFQTEDAVLMLEVVPKATAHETSAAHSTIGQVVLKRLLSADQVIERLCQEAARPPQNTLQPESTHPLLNANGNMPVTAAPTKTPNY
ncbi:MAG: hypothetical protein WBA76_16710 [Phormidesmis sp.]